MQPNAEPKTPDNRNNSTTGHIFVTPPHLNKGVTYGHLSNSANRNSPIIIQDTTGYFKGLKELRDASRTNIKVNTKYNPIPIADILNLIKKCRDAGQQDILFEPNQLDLNKNIFHYLTFVESSDELKILASKLAEEANKKNIDALQRAVPGDPQFSIPIIYAAIWEKEDYALLLLQKMLKNANFENVKEMLDYKTVFKEEFFKQICKTLNTSIAYHLIDNYLNYPFEKRAEINKILIDLISKDQIFPKGKNESAPILHKIILASGQCPHFSNIILKGIGKNKLKELDTKAASTHDDTALLSAVYNFKLVDKDIFTILVELFDINITSKKYGDNIFHKLFRMPKSNLMPELITILIPLIDSNTIAKLLSEFNHAGLTPLAQAIKIAKEVISKENRSDMKQEIAGKFRACIYRLIEVFPDICRIAIDDQQNTLLMLAIQEPDFRNIIQKILKKSDLNQKNQKGETAIEIASEYNVKLQTYGSDGVQAKPEYFMPVKEHDKIIKRVYEEHDNETRVLKRKYDSIVDRNYFLSGVVTEKESDIKRLCSEKEQLTKHFHSELTLAREDVEVWRNSYSQMQIKFMDLEKNSNDKIQTLQENINGLVDTNKSLQQKHKDLEQEFSDYKSTLKANEEKLQALKSKLSIASIFSELLEADNSNAETDQYQGDEEDEELASSSSTATNKKKARKKEKQFFPEVRFNKIKDLDFKKVPLYGKSNILDKASIISFPKEKSVLRISKDNDGSDNKGKPSEEALAKIGRWGEALIFYKLIHYYRTKEKYKNVNIEVHSNSFLLRAIVDNHPTCVSLLWVNAKKESKKPYDILLAKQKSNGPKKFRYIDVKSTVFSDKGTIDMSPNEYALAKKKQGNYYLYRLYNTGRAEGLYVQKMKNPAEKFLEGKVNKPAISFEA